MLAANGTRQVKVLDAAPREFRRDPIVPLQRSETPQVKAYALKDAGTGIAAHGTEVHYDHRTQTYLVAQQSGGGSGQKLEPIGGRGNSLQSHVGWSPAVTGQSAFANNNNFGNFNANSSFNNGGGSFGGGSTFSGTPATAAPAAPSGGAGTAR